MIFQVWGFFVVYWSYSDANASCQILPTLQKDCNHDNYCVLLFTMSLNFLYSIQEEV